MFRPALRALRVAALFSVIVLVSACNRATPPAQPSSPSPSAPSAAAKGYHCPMHTSYHSDKPGNCPICGMQLVADEPVQPQDGRADLGLPGRAQVTIAPERQQFIGVRLEAVAFAPFSKALRVAARVEVDERRLSSVSLKFGGWIEELQVQAVGQLVKPGDALFTVYSPELLEAEKGYALARGSLMESDTLLSAARERLAKWDVGDDEIKAIESGTLPEPRTVVHAKTGGVVTSRNVTRGARVEAGQALFELADLSSVWVDGDVYEEELSLVRPGQAATLELVGGGDPIETQLAYVYPWIEPATRTARVRAEVPNPHGRLLPGQYGALAIHIDLGPQLTVDADAVVQTGTRALVFVARDATHFEPREVQLGSRSGGRIVVTNGLSAGESVVASATFLVDSESRLRATVAEAAMPGMPDMPGMKDMPGMNDAAPAPDHQH